MSQKDSQYEITCIFYSDTSKFHAGRDQVREVIKKLGMKIAGEEYMGLKELAYPIEKEKQGNYFLYKVISRPEDAHRVRSELRHNTSVLRMMVIKCEELWLT